MLYNKAIGATASAQKIYIESVFSTYLYTGNGSTQTITNEIDLSGKGGMVWLKNRSGANSNYLLDTNRGAQNVLFSDLTLSQLGLSPSLSSFNSTGFSLGPSNDINQSSSNYVSWTFRKAAKFFDVVTFTTSTTNTNKRVSHSLGSTPGLIIVKDTVNGSNWCVYHRSLDRNSFLWLNSTTSTNTFANFWGTADPTSADFGVNESAFGAGTWVAYVFAHDAGGFGDSGNDNVISCGSYTGNGSTSGPTVTLGWEPQWLLVKRAGGTGGWFLFDSMRGIADGGDDAYLQANASDAEILANYVKVTSTGFAIESSAAAINSSGTTFVYIAIRRGPMKTPTDATKVFSAVAQTGSGNLDVSGSFPPDLDLIALRSGGQGPYSGARLTGATYLTTSSTAAEGTTTPLFSGNGTQNNVRWINSSSGNYINWLFRRAPGFFDVVAYTGTGSARTVSHNLGVVPELIIVKNRNGTFNWVVYSEALGNNDGLFLNTSALKLGANAYWNATNPTATAFSLGAGNIVNGSTGTYIAYLFASCSGVSKVGSYTGTGTTQQINCGFTNGARFVLIKRTDSTGDWYTWDTARGIVAGSDPFLLLNSTAAENTSTDYIDPLSTGFEISSTAPAAINANGGSYIYLAIA